MTSHHSFSILKKTAMLFLVQVLYFTSFAQPAIGIELYSFRNQLTKDVSGTIKMIRSLGFTEVEMGPGTYGLQPAEMKKLLDDNGLKVVSWGAGFDELKNNPQKVIDQALFFGAKYVVCFWLPHENDQFLPQDADNAIAVFNTAGKLLREKGFSLCYHPHGYEFSPYKGKTLFDYLVTNFDPRYANFEMDVFWIKHPGQDPVALLKKYRGRFPLMHLKDRKPGTPGNQLGQADVESNVVLGSGDVGIAAIMKATKKAGVKHYFIEDESSRSEVQVPESMKFLRKEGKRNHP